MSRMIVAALFTIGLAFASGCGSKDEGEAPNVAVAPDSNSDPNANPRGEPKIGYELDPAKQIIPNTLVTGILAGEFVMAEAKIEDRKLIFRKASNTTGEPWEVQIDLPPEALQGEPYKLVIPHDQIPGVSIFIEFPKPIALKSWEFFQFRGWNRMKFLGWRGGCSLTLELGKRTNGRIPGRVYLALGELDTKNEAHRQMYIAGTFEAERPRQPTDPPTVEDVPFINGSVFVHGAAPDSILTVGYAATPIPSVTALGGTEIRLGDPVIPARWSQIDNDKPRITNLIAGDGMNVPSRYEHSRLMPGRYLVFAALKNGPAAWKWVFVMPNSTNAVDLTIDATQTGGLEVVVPLGARKVQVAPADEPRYPACSSNLFTGITWQLGLERDAIGRKALYKNLAPGRYEVRSAGEVRFVQVVAEKVAELDFDRPQPEPTKPPEPAPEPKPKP